MGGGKDRIASRNSKRIGSGEGSEWRVISVRIERRKREHAISLLFLV